MNFITACRNHNLFAIIHKNRYLIWQIMKRDIQNKYKGTFFGVIWTFLVPLFLISVYTFVFSVVFKVKWGIEVTNDLDFAFVLFAGVNLYNMFAENLTRSPNIVLNNPNYVKKVVFPLEILAITIVGSSLFNMFIGYFVLIVIFTIISGFSITMLLLPIIVVPMLFFSLGIAWLFSSLGVFIRDISNLTQILVILFMFMSPVFYPLSAIPEKFRFLYYLNPLTYGVTQVRQVLLWSEVPDIKVYIIYLVVCFIFMELSYLWFIKTKKGFADVL